MARLFTRASSQYLFANSAAGGPNNWLFFCWVYLNSINIDQVFFGMADSTDANDFYQAGILSNNHFFFTVKTYYGVRTAEITSVTATTGVWYPVGLRVVSDADRTIYVNGGTLGGGAQAQNTQGHAGLEGLDRTSLGALLKSGGNVNHLNGRVAYPVFKNSVGTAQEIADMSITDVFPDEVITPTHYWTLQEASGTADDSVGAQDLSEAGGTIPFADDPFSAGSGQTVTPPLVDASSAPFSPQLNHALAVPLVASAEQVFAPASINQRFSPPLVASAEQVFSPTVIPDQFVTPDLVASAEQVFNPLLFGEQFITPALVGGDQIFDANVTQGAVSLQPPLVASGEQVFNHALTTTVDVLPDLLASAEQVFNPLVNSGPAILVPSALVDEGQVFAPQLDLRIFPDVVPGPGLPFAGAFELAFAPSAFASSDLIFEPQLNQQLSAPLVPSAEEIYEPGVNVGTQQVVSVPFTPSVGQIFAPQIKPRVRLFPPLLASAEQVFAPNFAITVDAGFTGSAEQVFSPTVAPAPVTLTPPLVASAEQVFDPNVNVDTQQSLSVPFLPSVGQTFAPVVTSEVDITPELVASAEQVFSPTAIASQFLTIPFVSSVAQVYSPAINPTEQQADAEDVALHCILSDSVYIDAPLSDADYLEGDLYE